MTGQYPALTSALAPLVALNPGEVVTLPPRRLPLESGRECLVQWTQERAPDCWKLALTERPIATDDRDTAIASFTSVIDLGGRSASVDWHNPRGGFAEWVEANLSRIVTETIVALPAERAALRIRAGVRGSVDGKTSVADFVPHMLIAAALAAFVYMFVVVNLN